MSYTDAYDPLITSASATYSIPAGLLKDLLEGESSLNPNADNGVAQGIAQFTPATAAQYGVSPFDPSSAIPGAAQYLADLFARFKSWVAAINAYQGLPVSNTSPANAAYGGAYSIASAADNADGDLSSSQVFQNNVNSFGFATAGIAPEVGAAFNSQLSNPAVNPTVGVLPGIVGAVFSSRTVLIVMGVGLVLVGVVALLHRETAFAAGQRIATKIAT